MKSIYRHENIKNSLIHSIKSLMFSLYWPKTNLKYESLQFSTKEGHRQVPLLLKTDGRHVQSSAFLFSLPVLKCRHHHRIVLSSIIVSFINFLDLNWWISHGRCVFLCSESLVTDSLQSWFTFYIFLVHFVFFNRRRMKHKYHFRHKTLTQIYKRGLTTDFDLARFIYLHFIFYLA